MTRTRLLQLYRVGFAVLVLIAIAAQIAALSASGRFDALNFFSYFTILSNLFAAVLFLVGAAGRPRRSKGLDLLRGASVVYLVLTFIVFALLLAGSDVDLAIPWVDTVLHKIFPIVVFLDWLIEPPAARITLRQGLLWLAFPAAWLGYTMARGALTGRYPYPFLDPANGGYASVAVTSIGILVLMTLLCVAVTIVGNAFRERGPTGAAGTT